MSENKKNQQVSLVLGSGGARGLAHVGVIKALEENNIPIDLIVGSSAGALVGGVYLAMQSIEKVEDYVRSITYKDLAWVFLDIGSLSGIIRGEKIELYLEKILFGQTIESLHKKFVAVATDLSTGKAVVLEKGSLARAIRASSAVPALIDSVHFDGLDLVDGGTSYPVPVPIARRFGAHYIIAVNLDVYPSIKRNGSLHLPTISDMGIAAIDLLRFNLAKQLCKGADRTILPDVGDISPINLVKFLDGEKIIERGYQAALKMIPKIKADLEM